MNTATKAVRIWHKGQPPHIGWWNASKIGSYDTWRWWNGSEWSVLVYEEEAQLSASIFAKHVARIQVNIQWTDYYPVNARVPRVDPSKMASEPCEP